MMSLEGPSDGTIYQLLNGPCGFQREELEDPSLGLTGTLVHLSYLQRDCPEAIAAARKDPGLSQALLLLAYIAHSDAMYRPH